MLSLISFVKLNVSHKMWNEQELGLMRNNIFCSMETSIIRLTIL